MSKLFKATFDVILEDLVGDTSWHGETNADAQSFDNINALEPLLFKLLERVTDNARLPDNALATASGQKLQKQAQAMVNRLKAECE